MGLFGFFRRKKTMTLEEAVREMKRKGYSDKEIKDQLLPRATEQVLGGLGVPKERIKERTTELMKEIDTTSEAEKPVVLYRWVLGKCGGDWRQVMKDEGIKITNENYCSDCELRHGETGTLAYFQNIGLPKSGFSACQEKCGCSLEKVGS